MGRVRQYWLACIKHIYQDATKFQFAFFGSTEDRNSRILRTGRGRGSSFGRIKRNNRNNNK